MEINSKIILYDERRNKYKIESNGKIGEGAQGAVYKVDSNDNVLLKIVKNKKKGNILRAKVNAINSLELNQNLNFAIPLLNLDLGIEECEGYVMLLMEDMIPISELLKTTFKNYDEAKKWYEETGGIKRRIEILKKIAYNLYQLHSRGLVYGDISPNNIFVSKDKEYSEAWFIDCDNIDFHYNIDFTIGSPGFCSPEIRKSLPPYNEEKKVNTIENDIYAFANLAHIFLFLADPFKGSILESLENNEKEDDWDNWDEEEDKEKIFDYGQVAWIGEENEDNKPIYGLSPIIDKIITKKLKRLFKMTLGKEGRENPKIRPSLRLWYEEFKNISFILNDSKCNCGYFYYELEERCKNCDKKSDLILLEINYKNGKNKKSILKRQSVEKIEIFNGDLGIGNFDRENEKIIGLLKLNKKFYLKNYSDRKIKFKEKIKDTEFEIELPANHQENILNFLGTTIELDELIINIRSI